jgi:hypothetical protein
MRTITMRYALPLGILALLAMSSCSHPLKARGTFGKIQLNEFASIRAELLSVNDTALIIKRANESNAVELYKHEQIRSLELEGISNGIWRPLLILIGVIPVISLITGLADSRGSDGITFGLVGGIITVLSYIGFETTEPRTEYKWPLTSADRSQLQLYTRFPYGVTDEQLKSLKSSYGIDDAD